MNVARLPAALSDQALDAAGHSFEGRISSQ